jgi:putative membrane protein
MSIQTRDRTAVAPLNAARLWLTLGAAVALYFVFAFAITQAMAAESAGNFVRDAAGGNQFEISSSLLALQKAQNSDVKKFAQHMIDDHSKAGDDLKAAISISPSADVEMPSGQLDSKHEKLLQNLQDESSNNFDKLYVSDQIDAHDDAVKLFKSYAKSGDTPALKQFAAQTLPTLKSHQQLIHKIKSSM